jgi:hypothetical protein
MTLHIVHLHNCPAALLAGTFGCYQLATYLISEYSPLPSREFYHRVMQVCTALATVYGVFHLLSYEKITI